MNKSAYLDSLAGTFGLAWIAREALRGSRFLRRAIVDRVEEGMFRRRGRSAMGSAEVVAESILGELPVVPRAVAKTKRKSPVLLWILAIAGSPLWIPLAAAFAIVVAAVYL